MQHIIGNGEEEIVERSGGGSGGNIIEYPGDSPCRDKIIIPAIPGGRDDVPSGTWKDLVGGERGSMEPGTRHM